MRCAGLDIGSRSTKFAVVEEGELIAHEVVDTSYEPLVVCKKLLHTVEHDRLVVTGYGRHLINEHWSDAKVITEIKAAAIGARAVAPTCRTILDIGGQDTKAIALDGRGKTLKFAMNDRCAAGTGRFLEVMATALAMTREEFIDAATRTEEAETLNSMCAVFAESEVISLIARGVDRNKIARGIHQAVAKRTQALLKRVPLVDDLLFAGGGALNGCLVTMLERGLGMKILRPENPQIVAALGCALHGWKKSS